MILLKILITTSMADQRRNNDTMTVLVDSDVFVSLGKEKDALHEKSLSLVGELKKRGALLVTSNYVFSEAITVISQRVSRRAAVEFIEKFKTSQSSISCLWIDTEIESLAIEIFKNQTSKNVSFVDCTNIALVQLYNMHAIFSFDKIYSKNGVRMVEDIIPRT